MPLYHVAPTQTLPHTMDLIQRQGVPRFRNEAERDQQYPNPEVDALAIVSGDLQHWNGRGWLSLLTPRRTLINNHQDVNALNPPDGAVLTWSAAAQAWGWSMPVVPVAGWCDDFERSTIGGDWDYYGTHVAWDIDGHSAGMGNASGIGSYSDDALYRAGPVAAGQWCEIDVTNLWPPADEQGFGAGLTNYYPTWGIYLNADPAGYVEDFFRVSTVDPGGGTAGHYHWNLNVYGDPGDQTTSGNVTSATHDETTAMMVRFEAASGSLRGDIDGTLVGELTGMEFAPGDRVAIWTGWAGQATAGNPYPVPTTGPRITNVCLGTL